MHGFAMPCMVLAMPCMVLVIPVELGLLLATSKVISPLKDLKKYDAIDGGSSLRLLSSWKNGNSLPRHESCTLVEVPLVKIFRCLSHRDCSIHIERVCVQAGQAMYARNIQFNISRR